MVTVNMDLKELEVVAASLFVLRADLEGEKLDYMIGTTRLGDALRVLGHAGIDQLHERINDLRVDERIRLEPKCG